MEPDAGFLLPGMKPECFSGASVWLSNPEKTDLKPKKTGKVC